MDDWVRWLAIEIAVAATALAFFGEAWGSGFQIRENSASALGNAFAGAAASSEDPSIIANNPAGMIGLSGNQVSGDIGIIIPSAVFSEWASLPHGNLSAAVMAAMRWVLSLFLRLMGSMMPHPI